MTDHWYFTGADGHRYCYSKEPGYRCPVGWTERDGEGDLAPSLDMEEAATVLGADPQRLARALTHNAHRARVDERLTNDCATCGARLEKLGYRYWIEEHNEATLSSMLGGDGYAQSGPSWWAKTKKDAQAWARMRAREGAA